MCFFFSTFVSEFGIKGKFAKQTLPFATDKQNYSRHKDGYFRENRRPGGRWSRQISKKHRLVYRIYETEVVVLVIAAYGHYDDK